MRRDMVTSFENLRRAVNMSAGREVIMAEPNPFQMRCLILLDEMSFGLERAPLDWAQVKWTDHRLTIPCMSAVTTGLHPGEGICISTAVMLAHNAAITFAIAPSNEPGTFIITMTDRSSRQRAFRHPQLDHVVGAHKHRFPALHPVHFTV